MKDLTSVDFWAEKLIKDTNPDHFDFHENFISYMYNKKICGFGNWMWNNGYNVGLFNLQTKINTYCVPQWISVKDKLPDKDGKYLVCGKVALSDIHGEPIQLVRFTEHKEWLTSLSVKYWMFLPELPKENNNAY